MTGFAGHNRGKKFIKGVGYRFPERPPVPPRVCDGCGEQYGIAHVEVVSVHPMRTIALCLECAKEKEAAEKGHRERR